ncbi:MAG: tetratricopeptide repeat protein [Candidatus Zixiibacteriota bacterium]
MKIRILLASAAITAATALGVAGDGPSLADLDLLRVPREEIPPGEAELANKLQYARALILGGKAEEALSALDEVAARDTAGTFSVEILYYRGFALDMLGQYDAALVNYEEALALQPDDPTILLAMGQASLDAGRDDDARARFERVLELSPGESRALTGLAYLDLTAGDSAGAKEKLEQALASDAGNALAMSYMGLVEMGNRKFDLARAHLENALALEPDNLTANYNLAGIYLMQGDFALAEEHYRRVLERKPEDGEARYYLARALEGQGRYKEALAEAELVVESGVLVEGLVETLDRLERLAGGE